MDFAFVHFIKQFLLPPSLIILFFTAAFILQRSHKDIARKVFLFSLIILTLLSMPLVANRLMTLIEVYPALTESEIQNNDRQAIVVLGGGRRYDAIEYGGDTVSDHSLIRVRYAAKLQKVTQLPILITGGSPLEENELSEAELMAGVLTSELSGAVTWLESRSRNTAENAIFSAEILKQNNIDRIFLVTQAWHLQRAVAVFEKQGLNVLPAPTAFEGGELEFSLWLFIPGANAFADSAFALHEILGNLWYLIRY